jgi:hypothetical protein
MAGLVARDPDVSAVYSVGTFGATYVMSLKNALPLLVIERFDVDAATY